MKKPQGLVFIFGLLSIVHLTCGIDDYYYLPQIPESRITPEFNNKATIIIPSMDSSQFYYFMNYAIFYRIYVSDLLLDFKEDIIRQTPDLLRDYNNIEPSTNPINTTATTSIQNLFLNRKYYRLEVDNENLNRMIPIQGGTLTINFPTNVNEENPAPYLTFRNDTKHLLKRSGDLISPVPKDDMHIINSDELSNFDNATNDINADVAGRSGLTDQYCYVSMYIIAEGQNPSTITPIYSKPTHINVFKLPEKF
jgi:hypothetical protein